jgi:hypothetical protein
MRDFIKATEYDAHMHAKFEDLILSKFFVKKYFKFGFLGIFHGAIIHKYIFGQGQSIYLLKRIHTKFILHFSELSTNFYLISKFGNNFYEYLN